jgi:hypothetical protein
VVECNWRLMARGISWTRLFHFAVTQRSLVRATNYKEAAARLRRMAQLETNEKLRKCLVGLARQYEELVESIIRPKRRD